MRKLIIFLVTGILWCNVGIAQIVELYKCYPIKGKRTFESFEDYQKDGTLEDLIYSINAETGKITRLIIFSDDYLEKDLEKQRIVYKRDKEEFKKKYHK